MNTFLSQRALGIIAVFIASFLWGTTGTVATFAPDVSPIAIGAIAMGGGGLLQALFAFNEIKVARPQLRQQRHLLLTGAVMVAIYPLAFYTSMHLAGVTIGCVISIGSAPLFSAILEFLLEKLMVSKRWLFGALIGLVGITLLCFSENRGLPDSASPTYLIWGVVLGLIAGLSYATYSWTARQMIKHGIKSGAAMGATFGLGAVLLMPVLLLTGAPLLTHWHNAIVGAYMAVIPMLLGYLCFGFALARITASLAITITLLEPIIAAILAMIVVGERLTTVGWCGALLVLACLICITLPEKKITT